MKRILIARAQLLKRKPKEPKINQEILFLQAEEKTF